MAKGSNTGAVIFLAILAVAGLGLSGYLFVNDQFLEEDEITFPGDLRLVAMWDDLDENLTNNPLYSTASNFLIEYEDQVYLDTNYVHTVNNTRFNLLVPGLYKINLNVILSGVNDISTTYWIYLIVNNTESVYFMRLQIGSTAPSPITIFYYSSSSVYINNTSSEDYYEIKAYGYDDFSVTTDSGSSHFNQFSIEYVIQ